MAKKKLDRNKIVREAVKEYNENQGRMQAQLSKNERLVMMYSVAADVARVNGQMSESETYFKAYEKCKETGDTFQREDGTIVDAEYFLNKYFEFYWATKSLEKQLNRKMIEFSISVDEINEFMKSMGKSHEKEENSDES